MTFEYQGNELDLFRHATTWKRYYGRKLRPYIGGDVLEVGAGIGGTAPFLCDGTPRSWTCLEPDPALVERLRATLAAAPLPSPTTVVCGTLDALPPAARYDTILYIDVLEHIENDGDELRRAGARLTPGGRVIVLCPAHQALFSPFDQAIGHFRRYTATRYAQITPPTLRLERTFYLDGVGMLASLANATLLKSGYPTAAQVKLWDRVLVRASQVLDPLTAHRLGKSVIGVWRPA